MNGGRDKVAFFVQADLKTADAADNLHMTPEDYAITREIHARLHA